jgi:hypothetical protein
VKVSDFGGDVDKWASYAKGLLSETASRKVWAEKLGKGREPLDTLLELWQWLSNWGPSQKDADPDDATSYALEELPEFRALTNILATWCDHSRQFDPTPFLGACDALEAIHDASPVSGELRLIPDRLWDRWHTARDVAHILIRRIRLQMVFHPDSPEEEAQIDFKGTIDRIGDEWKDVIATGLLFHSGGKMTNKAISDHLGYDDQSGLRRLRIFSFWGSSEVDPYDPDKRTKPRIDRVMEWMKDDWGRMKRQDAQELGEKRRRAKSRKKPRKQRF